MVTKIAIIGSRKLACILTQWLVLREDIRIVGAIVPPFKERYSEEFKQALVKNNINIYTELHDLILSEKPEIIFSINYWKIISKHHIDSVPKGIINIHHSYLLRFKGRYTASWAIINARKDNCWVHGTTLHYIDERLDEGLIIDSRQCKIGENDTAQTLFDKVEILAIEMFKSNFEKLLKGVQDFLEPSKLTYFYGKDSNLDLEIDKDLPIEDIYDHVRAWSFSGRPKPFIRYNDKKIYLSLDCSERDNNG